MTFCTSHYLNEITESSRRATVLSFRSLAQNLAYGGMNILFAVLMAAVKLRDPQIVDPFGAAMKWLPVYAALLIIVLAIFSARMLGSARTRG